MGELSFHLIVTNEFEIWTENDRFTWSSPKVKSQNLKVRAARAARLFSIFNKSYHWFVTLSLLQWFNEVKWGKTVLHVRHIFKHIVFTWYRKNAIFPNMRLWWQREPALVHRELHHDVDGNKNVINLHIWQRKKAASMWVSLTDPLGIE